MNESIRAGLPLNESAMNLRLNTFRGACAVITKAYGNAGQWLPPVLIDCSDRMLLAGGTTRTKQKS